LRKVLRKGKTNRFAFRSLVDPESCENRQSRRTYEKIVKESGKVPEIYRVKALADNPDWLNLLHNSIFRWPPLCSLDEKTKELVGIAKSIAYLWEPGVLTNIEGALDGGATSDEITETILVASTISGFANAEKVISAVPAQLTKPSLRRSLQEAREARRIHDDARKTTGSVPALYRSRLMLANVDWLAAIHRSTKILYSHERLDPRSKALIRLAASAAKGWERGIQEHSRLALKSGATMREITDVLASVYKTTASIAIQVGFGVPCSIPENQGYKLLRDHYSKHQIDDARRTRGRR
jgi:alkylhydroperoxidase/carboxymuconolactone decarboxylase family protein YurZ